MKSFKIFFFSTLISFLLSAPLFANNSTPQDVVTTWTQVCGVDQMKASNLTTSRFRGGKNKQPWADEIYKSLKKMGYRHLGGEIINKLISKDVAVIVLQSSINTLVGKTSQKESYLLIHQNDEWLIDQIAINDEVIKVKGLNI